MYALISATVGASRVERIRARARAGPCRAVRGRDTGRSGDSAEPRQRAERRGRRVHARVM
jgi:hypothetical protein